MGVRFMERHPGEWFGYTDQINKLYEIIQRNETDLRILRDKVAVLEKRVKDLEVTNQRRLNAQKARDTLEQKRASKS